MLKNVIEAKVIRCNGSKILAETRAGNQLFLFLGHVHPEYKKLKKKHYYQFLINPYAKHFSPDKRDVDYNVSRNHLLHYNFEGGNVYNGIIHGEIIRHWASGTRFKYWILVDSGIINWIDNKELKNGTFIKIGGRLGVEKIYDMDDNLIEP